MYWFQGHAVPSWLAMTIIQQRCKSWDCSKPWNKFHIYIHISKQIRDVDRVHNKWIYDATMCSIMFSHCGLVMAYGDIGFGPPVPNHNMDQCWLYISFLLNSPESRDTGSTRELNSWYVFGIYTFKITYTSPRCQWVKLNEIHELHKQLQMSGKQLIPYIV